MNVEVFALCDAATDSGGKLNVLGAFDSLQVGAYPTVYPHCAVAVRIRFRRIEQGNHRFLLHFVDEDGKLLISPLDATINIAIPPSESSVCANLILNIRDLNLPAAGVYAINLAVDGRQEATLPLIARI
ncbi:MAG: hypothetical protein VB089_02095, partial [Anaerolineaceae bacterium]|nr:hypothetical protein [Anaerolineaceae bacterium]